MNQAWTEGARGRQHQEGQRDVGGQHREDGGCRRVGSRRFPELAGQDRQGEEGNAEGEGMDEGLKPGADEADQGVGVDVAEKECGLVEGEAQRPNGGNAAEPGEDALPDDRLDEEDQEGRGEDRASEEQQRSTSGICPSRVRTHSAHGSLSARRRTASGVKS